MICGNENLFNNITLQRIFNYASARQIFNIHGSMNCIIWMSFLLKSLLTYTYTHILNGVYMLFRSIKCDWYGSKVVSETISLCFCSWCCCCLCYRRLYACSDVVPVFFFTTKEKWTESKVYLIERWFFSLHICVE